MKTKISAVISAYNEEEKIEACLKSLAFVDEIVFVDNSSTDKTIAIAKRYTSSIFKRPNNLMLNTNKNYGFTKAKNDWILSLDADEQITKELAEEINKTIETQTDISGYWILRKNILFGKWIQNGIWWPDYQLRLFKKEKGRFPEKHVHEYLEVEGKTEKLQEAFIHENYSSISQFMYKLDKIYTENEVKNFIEKGRKITWSDSIKFPIQDFVKTFFAQKGYKDGLHGLVLSLLQAFYAEIVFAKIWEKEGFQQKKISLTDIAGELKKSHLEIQYWLHTAFIEEEKNIVGKIKHRLSRRKAKRNLDNLN